MTDTDYRQAGRDEFQKSEYDQLREYVQALEESNIPTYDAILNFQGTDLEPIDGVSAPSISAFTISEYIVEQGDFPTDLSNEELENAEMKWQEGALDALKA